MIEFEENDFQEMLKSVTKLLFRIAKTRLLVSPKFVLFSLEFAIDLIEELEEVNCPKNYYKMVNFF